MLDAAVAIAVGLVVSWIVLIAALVLARPDKASLADALRLLPDLVRLLRGIATDRALPRSVRVPLWLLFVYLAIPIDVIPDFIPVLGYADDAIVVALVLRGVVKRAGIDAVRRHWHGTEEGFDAVARLARL